jgi:hypothetical protein
MNHTGHRRPIENLPLLVLGKLAESLFNHRNRLAPGGLQLSSAHDEVDNWADNLRAARPRPPRAPVRRYRLPTGNLRIKSSAGSSARVHASIRRFSSGIPA